jgi:hypothetical protein
MRAEALGAEKAALHCAQKLIPLMRQQQPMVKKF